MISKSNNRNAIVALLMLMALFAAVLAGVRAEPIPTPLVRS